MKGPRHEQIMECAAKVQKDFETYMENFHRKCKERPKEDQRKLLDEEPFHCDAIAEQQRLVSPLPVGKISFFADTHRK